jgi:hypothetical protein
MDLRRLITEGNIDRMFENDASHLDAARTLAAAARAKAAANDAEVDRLILAAHYADLFPSPSEYAGDRSLPGRERGMIYGGPGCPGVAEFAVAEYGAVLHVSTDTAAIDIGQALALVHRHPKLWAAVLARTATAWRARLIATEAMGLSLEAAAIVDDRVHAIVDTLTSRQVKNIVRAAKWEADPEAARAEAERNARERGVYIGRSDEHGTTTMFIKAATGPVIRLNATITQLADALAALGDTDSLQQRRAKAIDILSDPALADQLLKVAQYLATNPAAAAATGPTNTANANAADANTADGSANDHEASTSSVPPSTDLSPTPANPNDHTAPATSAATSSDTNPTDSSPAGSVAPMGISGAPAAHACSTTTSADNTVDADSAGSSGASTGTGKHTVTDVDTSAGADVDTATSASSDVDTSTDTDTGSGTDTDTGSDTDADADTGSDTDADTGSGSGTGTSATAELGLESLEPEVTRDGELASDLFLADEPSTHTEADRDTPHPSENDHPLDPPAMTHPSGRPVSAELQELVKRLASGTGAAARHDLATKLAAIKHAADTDTTNNFGATGSRPGRTKLYIHLTDETLLAGGGTMRVENFGPVFTPNLAELLGHDRIVVQPVIDLNNHIDVNAYEIPQRIRERIKLRYPVEQFPYGTAETTNGTDLDHISKYVRGGPPGQTSTTNLQPLGRFSHRVKTHAPGWSVQRVNDYTIEWITRHGYKFHVDDTGTHPVIDPDAYP